MRILGQNCYSEGLSECSYKTTHEVDKEQIQTADIGFMDAIFVARLSKPRIYTLAMVVSREQI